MTTTQCKWENKWIFSSETLEIKISITLQRYGLDLFISLISGIQKHSISGKNNSKDCTKKCSSQVFG